jgi:hypothetical protein
LDLNHVNTREALAVLSFGWREFVNLVIGEGPPLLPLEQAHPLVFVRIFQTLVREAVAALFVSLLDGVVIDIKGLVLDEDHAIMSM